MKFRSIKMKNFMRYKGTNEIEFSCDKEKNVTVILGDKTVGKTTIAQAFRWGLYGAIFTERNRKAEDYQLLNNDVLAMMDANSQANVAVELVAEDDEKIYRIYREIIYARLYPKMMTREIQKKLKMTISKKNDYGVETEVEEAQISNVINELFPMDLSHYFLFDGERWSDVTVKGIKENIKDSVHILTGLSSCQAAMWHLKDMGANSVIKKFKGKIQGSGNLYDSYEKECKELEHEIEKCEEKIKVIDIEIQNYTLKCQEVTEYLERNKNTEVMQTKYKNLQVVQRSQAERAQATYRSLVNEFSEKGYMLFAKPLIDASLKVVKSVAGERRDIPHMRQGTIDYIIKTGKCICGTDLTENSHALECLLEQRNYLPPADMGSLLGEFEKTGTRWKNKCDACKEDLNELAHKVDDSVREYSETQNQIALLNKGMEEHVDFKEKRMRLNSYENEMRQLGIHRGELQGNINNYKRRIQNIEEQMRLQEAQSEENQKWRNRLEVAEEIYERIKKDFEEKEKKTFIELNAEIQKNFERMFNAKDKKIQLTDQYEIQMLYQTPNGFREEKNLSEGEKIARNFAFIVTIMEYSRKKKNEKTSYEGEYVEGDTLPIVLDGPFSKLGDENINLIAKVLPEVSEQVILFMLKKDWEYTGLDEFVGASYYIDKKADEAFASVRKVEG